MSARAVTAHLRAELADLKARNILVSEREVIARLLPDSPALDPVRLDPVYADLADMLRPRQWQAVLGAIITCAALWNPERTAADRDARRDLADTNADIAAKAHELARLLNRRGRLANQSGFSTTAEYHPVDLLDRAADLAGYGLYHSYLRPELHRLLEQYDLKYWPALPELVQAIADDAEQAEVYTNNPLTEAATESRKASRLDFYRAVLVAIDELRDLPPAWLPSDFRMPLQMLADLGNAALGTDPDDWTTADHLKELTRK